MYVENSKFELNELICLFCLDRNETVRDERFFLKLYNRSIHRRHDLIAVIDGRMRMVIRVDHSIKVIRGIHLIGKYNCDEKK